MLNLLKNTCYLNIAKCFLTCMWVQCYYTVLFFANLQWELTASTYLGVLCTFCEHSRLRVLYLRTFEMSSSSVPISYISRDNFLHFPQSKWKLASLMSYLGKWSKPKCLGDLNLSLDLRMESHRRLNWRQLGDKRVFSCCISSEGTAKSDAGVNAEYSMNSPDGT